MDNSLICHLSSDTILRLLVEKKTIHVTSIIFAI